MSYHLNPSDVLVLPYARVSHDSRGTHRSVDEQLDEIQRWCEREGWAVSPHPIIDNDISASRHGKKPRSGWEEVKSIIQDPKRPETMLMTWTASRASRDLAVYVELRNLCATHGMMWAYDGMVYDMTNGSDRMRTGIDALMAEDYAEKVRKDVLRAMNSNAQDGIPHGRKVFGYARAYVDANGNPVSRDFKGKIPTQVIIPQEAALVREAAKRFLGGDSTRLIANDWNARGIPTPMETAAHGWQLSAIRRMLTNPVMNGKRKHGDQEYEGNWPAILDDETFNRLQARFADPSRKTIRQRTEARLLTGVARCGYVKADGSTCNGPLGFWTKKRPNGKLIEEYTCRYGNHVSRNRLDLENHVAAHVIELARNHNLTQLDPSDDFTELIAYVDMKRGILEEARQEARNGGLSMKSFGQLERDIESDIRDAESRMRTSNIPSTVNELEASTDPLDYWENSLSVQQQREILRATVDVVVHPMKKRGSHKFERETVVVTQRG